ncbi:ubiquinone biosynthesis protein COQ9 [Acetobacter thailandicus]|uniref:RpsU-divergently transcribed protein n=1 Tax=Acetobacter thailandicus TaxID=1502842 RepID=A0ABT3QAY8_9PROT|nr:rpsU-divergently transcribed protein [Acetobacter thailandicus]MCX2562450.1 rpsU-divergently transcribed protein [Acetobacter thailandicus]NHN94516.1 rpsU-divergently transcribed protein [Acetobacter thailandicus]
MNFVSSAQIRQAVLLAVAGIASASTPSLPEHDPLRDEALRKLARQAGTRGWSLSVLSDVAGDDADLLFPGGVTEMIEAWSDLCDREMLDAAFDIREERLSRRVRQLLLCRLPGDESRRNAARAALRSLLVTPGGIQVLRRSLMRTVNAIWQGADDMSSGLTFVTKRLTLSHVYAVSLLYWLSRGGSDADMAAFIDRRLAAVLKTGQIKARLSEFFMKKGGKTARSASPAENGETASV